METAERRLNILFVQEFPCIRNYKMAKALRSCGHKVSLAYTKARLSQVYKGLRDDVYDGNIKLRDLRHLWNLAGEYDLIHCHNEPDVLSVAALAGEAPVIHDTHDLISLRAGGDANLAFFEGVANRGAHGRVYTTLYQQNEARELYGINGLSLVFNNYVSAGDLPRKRLPKLSSGNGQVHMVYEGGMGGTAHRDFTQLFFELAQNGIQLHVYPTAYREEIAAFFSRHPNLHYYQPESPQNIMEVMTQYDIGIIPFNLEKGNQRFLDSTMANKLFEYLAAGLPVVTSDLATYRDFFKENPVGFTFANANDITVGLPRLKQLAEKIDFTQYVRTYEGEISRLEEFYHHILSEHSGNGRGRVRPTIAVIERPVDSPKSGRENSPSVELMDRVSRAVLDLDQWIIRNGWAGFDPYDIRSYLIGQRRSGSLDKNKIEEILRRDQIEPGQVRQELGIKPEVNAKAMALFLSSYVLLTNLLPENNFNRQVSECQQWLLNNPVPGMSGLGWGYPFDWDSVVMIPAGTPTAVNSYHAGDAFWELYQATGEEIWLQRCLSVTDFFAQDLNRDQVGKDCLCFSYTPLDFYHVHNANLCVAEFLVRVGLEAKRPDLVDLGRSGLAFALRDLNEHGFLTYWARGYEPSPNNVGQVDHYHTAAELRSLRRLSRLLPDNRELAGGYSKYLDHYLENFFEDGAWPKYRPERTYPIDIHSAAEAAYILGETAAGHAKAMVVLRSFVPWFLDVCRNPDGSFLYQVHQVSDREHKITFPFMRWGQAWSMRGLVSVLGALSGEAGKKAMAA